MADTFVPSRIVTVHASAVADFFDCAARGEAKHLLGLRTPSSGASLLGSALHASTAAYDRGRIEGSGITADEAIGAAVDVIMHPREDVQLGPDESLGQIEDTAIALHTMYCHEIAPTQQYIAVEARCERLTIPDLGLALTGTTDRVHAAASGYGITDFKTGKRAVSARGTVETAPHRKQLGVYELLASAACGLPMSASAQIVGLQTGKTERGRRVAVSEPVTGLREELLGDAYSKGALESLSRMIHGGDFPGNPRSYLCGEKYCPIFNSCRFRG